MLNLYWHGPGHIVRKRNQTPACRTNTRVANQQHIKTHSGIKGSFSALCGNDVFFLASVRVEHRNKCLGLRAPEVSGITAQATGTVARHSDDLFRAPLWVDVKRCCEGTGGPVADALRVRLEPALFVSWWPLGRRTTCQEESNSRDNA